MTETHQADEALAAMMYEKYCIEVGGKAYTGDPLPDWPAFRADASKRVQSDAWLAVADLALKESALKPQPSPTLTVITGGMASGKTHIARALLATDSGTKCVILECPDYETIRRNLDNGDNVIAVINQATIDQRINRIPHYRIYCDTIHRTPTGR